jgi:hypothetical protein
MKLTEFLLDESIKVEKPQLNEKLMGYGDYGTIQIFGNDIIISDKDKRSINITRKDAVDLVKVLYKELKK